MVWSVGFTVLGWLKADPSAAQVDRRARDRCSASRFIEEAIAPYDRALVRLDYLATAASAAGWIPTLRFGARHGTARDLSSPTVTQANQASMTALDPRWSVDADLSFDVSLSFDLSRTTFASEEVRIRERQLTLAEDRLVAAERAARIWAEHIAGSHQTDAAILDVASGGWFTRVCEPADARDP